MKVAVGVFEQVKCKDGKFSSERGVWVSGSREYIEPADAGWGMQG